MNSTQNQVTLALLAKSFSLAAALSRLRHLPSTSSRAWRPGLPARLRKMQVTALLRSVHVPLALWSSHLPPVLQILKQPLALPQNPQQPLATQRARSLCCAVLLSAKTMP